MWVLVVDREIQNRLWIKTKAQNFATQVLRKHTFKIWRKNKERIFLSYDSSTYNLGTQSVDANLSSSGVILSYSKSVMWVIFEKSQCQPVIV